MKLGVIAGGGELPKLVVNSAKIDGNDIFVVAIKGFADVETFEDSTQAGIAEFGKIVKVFKKNKCTHVCFAGKISRPDFKTLKPDFMAMRHLPGAIKAAQKGDDALMRYLLNLFEKEGFEIVAPQDICKSLLLPEGVLGSVKINDIHSEDIRKACEIASRIGALDIGQGAVVARGVVLAVEAQEGTDVMLERVKKLPDEITGALDNRMGILAKMLKPGQESRVDLPTIGPMTVKKAAEAGIAGIVAEGGRAFVIDREIVIEQANQAGIFIAGLPQLKA